MTLSRRTLLLSGSATVALGALAIAALPAQAKQPETYTEAGVAIDGTDAVAYFTEGKPVAGSAEHTVDYKGSTWRFSSAENKSAFEANPDAYAPKYGGYCAYAMSKGYVAPTVPEAWSIVDGKLYLNYSVSVRDLWSEDIPGHIAAADANWPKPLEN